MNESNIFNDFLRGKQLKCTQPRKTILKVFLRVGGHIEIEELHRRISEEDEHIGKATVYRTMNLLVECGLAKENILSGGKRYFEKVYGREHHDHLVCMDCGLIIEFMDQKIEDLQDKIAIQYEFQLKRHIHQLFGLCKKCQ